MKVSQARTLVVEEDGRFCYSTNRHQIQAKKIYNKRHLDKTQVSIRLIEFIEEFLYIKPINVLLRRGPEGSRSLRLANFETVGS